MAVTAKRRLFHQRAGADEIALPFSPLHGDFFRLPNGALKSIIIGCNADHQTIAALIKEYSPKLPIKRAIRSPNIYKLEIVDYFPG